MGRLDSLLIIRGMNIYPAAIENIVFQFSDVAEFSARTYREGMQDELEIQIESTNPRPEQTAAAVAAKIRDILGFRAIVKSVPVGTCPRTAGKANRFSDSR